MQNGNKPRMGWEIKTFKDLRFISKNLISTPVAEMDFGNGYGILVDAHLVGYDVTILKAKKPTTKTYIPQKSLRRLTEEEVTEIMRQVQDFVKFTY